MARTRTETLGEALRAAGAERMPAAGRRRRLTAREALAQRLWEMALAGDPAACRLVLEYTEGRPVQRVVAAVTARAEMPPLTDEELARALAGLAAWRAAERGS